MATIALDVDDVLVDQVPALLRVYNRKYNDCLTPESFKTWGWAQYTKKACGDKLYELFTPQLYADAVPVESAMWGVSRLRLMNHKVIFVTSGPLGIAQAKQDWLKRYGFLQGMGEYGDGRIYNEFFQANDKAAIHADWLVDDRVETIVRFPKNTILFSRPWNKTWTVNSAPLEDGTRHERANSWQEIVATFEAIYGPVAMGALDGILPRESQDLWLKSAANNGVYSTARRYGATAGQMTLDELERKAKQLSMGAMLRPGGSDSGSRGLGANSPADLAAGKAVKYDGNKPRMGLIPPYPLMLLGKLFHWGTQKYADRNWEAGMSWEKVYNAMQRHTLKWWLGSPEDSETGLSHLASVAWCAFVLLEYAFTHPELDDRPVYSPATREAMLADLEKSLKEIKS